MEISSALTSVLSQIQPALLNRLKHIPASEVGMDNLDISDKKGEILYTPLTGRGSKPPVSIKFVRGMRKANNTPGLPYLSIESFQPDMTTLPSFIVHTRDTSMFNSLSFSDRDWEQLAYAYEATTSNAEMQLVDGERILWCYLGTNYSRLLPLPTLHNSCMRHSSNQRQIRFYVDCENVQLLVQFDPQGKVMGRALVWTLTNGEKFMDRVYGDETTIIRFKKYAKEQGWYSRRLNTYNREQEVIAPDGTHVQKQMRVYVGNAAFTARPWFDTFSRGSGNDGIGDYISNGR